MILKIIHHIFKNKKYYSFKFLFKFFNFYEIISICKVYICLPQRQSNFYLNFLKHQKAKRNPFLIKYLLITKDYIFKNYF